MRTSEPGSRRSEIGIRSIWAFAVLAILVVVGLVVWMTSDPTNRTASSPEESTTGLAPKAPPASSNTDPATQSSPR